MKTQITRFSPHQNAKVVSILMAVTSLIFIIPMTLMMSFIQSKPGMNLGPSPILFFIAPIFYLLFTYVIVFLGSMIYNFMAAYTGGIEFELSDHASNH